MAKGSQPKKLSLEIVIFFFCCLLGQELVVQNDIEQVPNFRTFVSESQVCVSCVWIASVMCTSRKCPFCGTFPTLALPRAMKKEVRVVNSSFRTTHFQINLVLVATRSFFCLVFTHTLNAVSVWSIQFQGVSPNFSTSIPQFGTDVVAKSLLLGAKVNWG